jgi:hypothetical protein
MSLCLIVRRSAISFFGLDGYNTTRAQRSLISPQFDL